MGGLGLQGFIGFGVKGFGGLGLKVLEGLEGVEGLGYFGMNGRREFWIDKFEQTRGELQDSTVPLVGLAKADVGQEDWRAELAAHPLRQGRCSSEACIVPVVGLFKHCIRKRFPQKLRKKRVPPSAPVHILS